MVDRNAVGEHPRGGDRGADALDADIEVLDLRRQIVGEREFKAAARGETRLGRAALVVVMTVLPR